MRDVIDSALILVPEQEVGHIAVEYDRQLVLSAYCFRAPLNIQKQSLDCLSFPHSTPLGFFFSQRLEFVPFRLDFLGCPPALKVGEPSSRDFALQVLQFLLSAAKLFACSVWFQPALCPWRAPVVVENALDIGDP
jgi:hypothetical protein